MKCVLLFLIIGTMQMYASLSYSQSAKLTLEVENISVAEILSMIEKESKFYFTYNPKEINASRKVSVQIKEKSVTEILDQIFPQKDVLYTINDKHIVLYKASSGKDPKSENSTQQKNMVSGTVVDVNGEPLIGVSITIKGSASGTITDIEGNFSIQADEGKTLEFTYLGYSKASYVVGPDKNIRIALTEDVQMMDEVVVIGYGTQKKGTMASSVAQINSKEINNRSVSQLSQAIAGQATGVFAIQGSGQPGEGKATIRIRGVGSFGSSADPFVLIDGIPGDMNTVDPNDVESISFLKDAASAAIYGTRAANGVILVTTKLGKSQKLKVSYNGYLGVQAPTALPEMVPSWDYATMVNEASPGSYSNEQIQKFRDGSDPDNYPNADYLGNFFKNSIQTRHNVTLSNSVGNSQYMASFGYLYQDGIVDKNNYDRYNVRFNLVSDISKTLKLTSRLSAIQTNNNEPAAPASMDFENMLDLISNAIRTPAIYPIKMSNGDWGPGVVNKGNPISMMESESFYQSRNTNVGLNLRLDWDVITGLKLSAIGGYDQNDGFNKRFRATQRINDKIYLSPSILKQNDIFYNYMTLQFLAQYDKKINNHEFNVLMGHTFEEGNREDFGAERSDFPSNDYPYLNLGDEKTAKNSAGNVYEWAMDSYLGRLMYNFKEKYLLEAAIRYDGSSKFARDNRYEWFPSVAGAWRIGQESFLKNHISWLDDLKIRASYGIMGNQNLLDKNGYSDYYTYQNVYETGSNYPFGGLSGKGVANVTLRDPNIRWESTETKDFGIEAYLFNQKLSFTATYFDKYTYDILVSPGAGVSKVLGKEVGQHNSGKLSNKGLEISVNHRNKLGDFSYNITGNFTYIKNKVLDLGVANVEQLNGLTGRTGNDPLFIGYPVNIYYGYMTDGLFTNEADVQDWLKHTNPSAIAPNPKPGDIRYLDISGPDGVPDGKVTPEYDRVVLGSKTPKYSFGINMNFDYKGFDMNILLQGVAGVNGYLDQYAGWAMYQNGNIQTWQRDERWTPENPNRYAKYPRMENVPNTGTNNANLNLISDYWMQNGSYLRIKNLQLGYTLPKKWIRNWKLDNVRINVGAENLFTFSNYRKGWDPEVNTGGAYYPVLRTYTFGLNVDF